MRFASSITLATEATQAVDELLTPIDGRVTPGMVDLALIFLTSHYDDDLEDIVERMGAAMPHAVLLGCTAEGTIGVNREIERRPSVALLAASLPEVCVRPFHITQDELDRMTSPGSWERKTGVSPDSEPIFVAMTDPFRLDTNAFVSRVNERYPGAPLVGGIASAGHKPGENRLIIAGDVVEEGAVGVTLSGDLSVTTIVSQGCRPIGESFVITKGTRNIVQEMGGQPALARLHGVLVGLSDEDERLARRSLFVGRVIDEYKGQFTRGDFLIHNIIGVDRKSGAIAIAGHAKVGATVQFHVRDAKSADANLRKMIAPHGGKPIAGAMLFGCNGRGTNMWPEPGHDIGVMRELLGDVPVAGFFCGGEFGPVGGTNFVHGFTASIALFHGED